MDQLAGRTVLAFPSGMEVDAKGHEVPVLVLGFRDLVLVLDEGLKVLTSRDFPRQVDIGVSSRDGFDLVGLRFLGHRLLDRASSTRGRAAILVRCLQGFRADDVGRESGGRDLELEDLAQRIRDRVAHVVGGDFREVEVARLEGFEVGLERAVKLEQDFRPEERILLELFGVDRVEGDAVGGGLVAHAEDPSAWTDHLAKRHLVACDLHLEMLQTLGDEQRLRRQVEDVVGTEVVVVIRLESRVELAATIVHRCLRPNRKEREESQALGGDGINPEEPVLEERSNVTTLKLAALVRLAQGRLKGGRRFGTVRKRINFGTRLVRAGRLKLVLVVRRGGTLEDQTRMSGEGLEQRF